MGLQGKEREEFEKQLEAYVGIAIGVKEISRDPVNQAMIRQWCEVLGDALPVYVDPEVAAKSVHAEIVAPPTMLQAWVLPGMAMATGEDDPANKQRELHRLFDSVGYTGVVATNTEQEYIRYLKLGDSIEGVTTIESISEQKATGLGIGYFINTRTVFQDQNGEEIGWMTFRVLKFEPAEQPAVPSEAAGIPAKPQRIRPALGHDNQWWWDGVNAGHFLIQRCEACGVLRHPPRPMCGECQSTNWDSVASTGLGTIYSYVVIHYPEIPGYEYPLAIAVVELEEKGIRFVSNVVDCDPESVRIGMQVEAEIREVDPEFKMVVFKPVV